MEIKSVNLSLKSIVLKINYRAHECHLSHARRTLIYASKIREKQLICSTSSICELRLAECPMPHRNYKHRVQVTTESHDNVNVFTGLSSTACRIEGGQVIVGRLKAKNEQNHSDYDTNVKVRAIFL